MEQENNEHYTKGYNSGYSLEKLDSKISNILAESLGQDSEYQKGMLAGKKQYEQERMAAQMREKFHIQTKERFNMASKSKGRSK